MKKRLKSGLAGLLGLAAASGVAVAAPDGALQRVAYHIDTGDPALQRAALRSVRNHLNDIGDDRLDIRVVLQGDGVTMLIVPKGGDGRRVVGNATDRVRVQIEDLRIRGVTFLVCGNSLRRRDVQSTERLFDVALDDIVDSGVGELVRLQVQGYTYIKP